MTSANFHTKNHYIPQLYLRGWESSSNKVWTFRTLVSNEKVPLWKQSSIKGIAYYNHLYTRLAIGVKSDDIEKWFDSEFESPAASSIEKVLADEKLTPQDYTNLIRFLAAQDVRTPVGLLSHIKKWEAELPTFLDETLQESVKKLENARSNGIKLSNQDNLLADYLPVNIEIEHRPDEENSLLKVETFAGRGSWLYTIKHLLTNTASCLQQHKWTIMLPAKGMEWLTSDDPVIKLNYYSSGNYDFKGGWLNQGTEIFLPLSPKHLLYTKVGDRPPQRGTRFSSEETILIRKLIVEHAHRLVFSTAADQGIEAMRSRKVDASQVESEKNEWELWHKNQLEIETSYWMKKVAKMQGAAV